MFSFHTRINHHKNKIIKIKNDTYHDYNIIIIKMINNIIYCKIYIPVYDYVIN
jgi:hypothetical protein